MVNKEETALIFDHIDGIISKDPDEVDVITTIYQNLKCGMDELVEKLATKETKEKNLGNES